jgi:hypothetical protein
MLQESDPCERWALQQAILHFGDDARELKGIRLASNTSINTLARIVRAKDAQVRRVKRKRESKGKLRSSCVKGFLNGQRILSQGAGSVQGY